MLNKLLRHEWRETWKVPAIALGCGLVLTAACLLYFSLTPPAGPGVALHVGNFMVFLGYTMLLSFLPLVMTLYFGVRFDKNMYTDEGYLMHTLPVSPWQHIAAKAGVATVWMYACSLLTALAISPVTARALPRLTYIDDADLQLFFDSFIQVMGPGNFDFISFAVVASLVSCCFHALFLFAAISMGQLFSKHRVLAAILCYIGLNALVSILSSVAMTPAIASLVITEAATPAASIEAWQKAFTGLLRICGLLGTALSVLLGAASFYLTDYILKRNLNLN